MKITIGDYLLTRLKELGIRHIIGEPGDFNLQFIEQIENFDGIDFVGMSNELNAAFAADGYSNENGISALLTTYSVGDLNALGGIAGSVSEHRPIVVISGAPPLYAMRNRMMTHHTLADGDYENVRRAMSEFVNDSVLITPANAAQEIDRLLRIAITTKDSVNLQIPSNISFLNLEVENMEPLEKVLFQSDEERLNSACEEIGKLFKNAKNPVVLVDKAVENFEVKDELLELIERTKTPFAVLKTAKAIYDESHPLYLGIYEGAESKESVRKAIEESDFLLSINPVFMQSNNGGFTVDLPENSVIIYADYIKVGEEVFEAVFINDFINYALENAPENNEEINVNTEEEKEFKLEESKKIIQEDFYAQISRYFKEGDVVYGETGTASHGLSEIKIPDGVKLVRSQVWGSIGAMLPMTMGAMLATTKKRHILLIGDGSFQVSVQALSRILYNKQNPVIFIIDNDGYTIERYIMGMKAEYNDIPKWNYTELPKVFSPDTKMKTFDVSTQGELENALKELDSITEGIIITVHMDSEDSPEVMKEYGKEKEEFNFEERGPENEKPDPEWR